jgi:uncharacterized low-complexity protein
MALSRRAKITAGVLGLTASALFATSGSAFAADDGGSGTELVIVEQAQAPAHSPGDCGAAMSTVADSR